MQKDRERGGVEFPVKEKLNLFFVEGCFYVQNRVPCWKLPSLHVSYMCHMSKNKTKQKTMMTNDDNKRWWQTMMMFLCPDPCSLLKTTLKSCVIHGSYVKEQNKTKNDDDKRWQQTMMTNDDFLKYFMINFKLLVLNLFRCLFHIILAENVSKPSQKSVSRAIWPLPQFPSIGHNVLF